MSEKTKHTLKNTTYGVIIAVFSSVLTFYVTRGIAYGNIAPQIDSISKNVEDHHSKDDIRDTDSMKRVTTLEEKVKNLEDIKIDVRDIRNYLLGKKK